MLRISLRNKPGGDFIIDKYKFSLQEKWISRKSMCLSIDLCKSEQKVFNIRYTSQLHSEGFDLRVK